MNERVEKRTLHGRGSAPGTVVLVLLLSLLASACFARDGSQIELVQQTSATEFGRTAALDFYRNPAYQCGVSGDYTFLVVNPPNDATASAPLWVFLHGGGAGYYDENGVYQATAGNQASTSNDEETFPQLWDTVRRRVVDDGGSPVDSVLRAAMQQGYRILAVSLCDHDLYSGVGGPYLNNPNGGTVDGHLATLAAVDFVTANYDTTDVYAHGTSAGSVGAFSLATTLASEGRPLKAVVADSYIITPRIFPVFEAFRGTTGFPAGSDFDAQGVIDKIGTLVDPTGGRHPEAMIAGGFTASPVLFTGGDRDGYCGGNQPPIPDAADAGLNNCDWVYQGIRDAIAAQPDSPHRVDIVDGGGHVVTHSADGLQVVEAFLTEVNQRSDS